MSADFSTIPGTLAINPGYTVRRNIADDDWEAVLVPTAKGHIGLGNVDNTADADKPISTLMQAALNSKASLSFVNNALNDKPSLDEDNKIAYGVLPYKVFDSPTRSLNNAYLISEDRDAQVSYSVDIVCGLTVGGGEVGTVILEYADDEEFTADVIEVARYTNGNTGTLVIGVSLNQTATAQLSGIIPYGSWVRLRTVNTTGTPDFTYQSGQEVLL